MTFIQTLNEMFPIRRSKAQKEAFRTWAAARAEEMGYAARTERNGSHQNLVVGDPETACVIFTAHYDTPAASFLPNLMTPRNLPFFWAYQVLQVGVLVLLGMAVGIPLAAVTGEDYLGFLAGYAVYMGCLGLLIFGPANKHNVNDNTSGVAAILETMARIPAAQRGKAAFVLFDNEEKGCLGSKAYAKAHPAVKEKGCLVNLDCVGDGEHILFLARKANRSLPQYETLVAGLSAQAGRELHVFPMEGSVFNSDQKHFKASAAVCACRKDRHIGYCCDRIHTGRDTVCEQVNLDFLAEGFAAGIAQL